MTEQHSERLAEALRGARLNGVLPEVTAAIEDEIALVTQRAVRDLNAGEMTPEAALVAWSSVTALSNMLRRLRSRVTLAAKIDLSN